MTELRRGYRAFLDGHHLASRHTVSNRDTVNVLPWEVAKGQMDEDVGERDEVVPACMVDAIMNIQRRVLNGSQSTVDFGIWAVYACNHVLEELCKAKVNEIDGMGLCTPSNQEVAWLHIPVDITLAVKILQAAKL